MQSANGAVTHRKKNTMMQNSQSSQANIEAIKNCLSSAAQAACELDGKMAADLQCLLRMASCEADRIRKAAKKPAAKRAAKAAPAASASKKPATKRAAKASAKVMPAVKGAAKSRRKSATLNGAAH
jgi:hypothetical protein